MSKTYYGFFQTTNCTTYNRDPYKFTNLKIAKKTMRAIAMGNNTGSGATWKVLDSLEEEKYQDEHAVAQGHV